MIDWVASNRGDNHETTFGYTRIKLYRKESNTGWRFEMHNPHDESMNISRWLYTKDLDEAKRRATTRVIRLLKVKRNDLSHFISMWEAA